MYYHNNHSSTGLYPMASGSAPVSSNPQDCTIGVGPSASAPLGSLSSLNHGINPMALSYTADTVNEKQTPVAPACANSIPLTLSPSFGGSNASGFAGIALSTVSMGQNGQSIYSPHHLPSGAYYEPSQFIAPVTEMAPSYSALPPGGNASSSSAMPHDGRIQAIYPGSAVSPYHPSGNSFERFDDFNATCSACLYSS
ncbi:hypothetical protein LPJ66_003198 [Kickxella alabastrina]|uniref:Uncharacterized protein n=1 Tax=Kickxella alabastrina TaxID=61397 RepID=A0ACC1ILD7_9FUNG|nr:hypothetical protein LPJ66_003198 [Kickxella alabastrina]